MTTIKQVLDADYWYMRGKKDAQKEFLDKIEELRISVWGKVRKKIDVEELKTAVEK